MKDLVLKFAAAALLAGGIAVGVQASPSDQSDPAKDATDPNKKICRSMGETGSRLKVQKVCMTRAEWDDIRRQQRMAVEHGQTSACMPGANC